jgi:hypothetical protein
MNADRDTAGPASLSEVFINSSDSVRDVLGFIPQLYYHLEQFS